MQRRNWLSSRSIQLHSQSASASLRMRKDLKCSVLVLPTLLYWWCSYRGISGTALVRLVDSGTAVAFGNMKNIDNEGIDASLSDSVRTAKLEYQKGGRLASCQSPHPQRQAKHSKKLPPCRSGQSSEK